MKLNLDKKHENKIELIVEGITTATANMIRRYSMSWVPTFAIDNITFYDNSGSFWDEYIAHRVGMIPIITPAKTAKSTEITFMLDVDGPKTVYASDMKSSDDEIKAAKDMIVIATLGPNQRLRFEGKAILGIGKKHAKFQAGLVSYCQEEKKIRFVVESFYHMPTVEVVIRGCKVIEDQIEKIESALSRKG